MSSLNTEIKAAINASDYDKARELLQDALPEADAETYHLASILELSAGLDKAKEEAGLEVGKAYSHILCHPHYVKTELEFLSKALELDPYHAEVRDKLLRVKMSIISRSDLDESELIADDFLLPVAKVLESSIVYIVPHSHSEYQTKFTKDTEVQVLERTENCNWINITYKDIHRQRMFAWIPSDDLGQIVYANKLISVSNLPVTELQFNTREEVGKLYEMNNAGLGCLSNFFTLIGIGADHKLRSEPVNGIENKLLKHVSSDTFSWQYETHKKPDETPLYLKKKWLEGLIKRESDMVMWYRR